MIKSLLLFIIAVICMYAIAAVDHYVQGWILIPTIALLTLIMAFHVILSTLVLIDSIRQK